jgi:hypothetical protein
MQTTSLPPKKNLLKYHGVKTMAVIMCGFWYCEVNERIK